MSEGLPTDIIIGVDTHKHTHAAVAITRLGARLGELTIQVSLGGYRELETWARSLVEQIFRGHCPSRAWP